MHSITLHGDLLHCTQTGQEIWKVWVQIHLHP